VTVYAISEIEALHVPIIFEALLMLCLRVPHQHEVLVFSLARLKRCFTHTIITLYYGNSFGSAPQEKKISELVQCTYQNKCKWG
jgi:hypothetical protein